MIGGKQNALGFLRVWRRHDGPRGPYGFDTPCFAAVMTFRKPMFRAVKVLTVVALERKITIDAADLTLQTRRSQNPLSSISL